MKYLCLALLVVALVPVAALASPSGLNNIPTADTCTPKVLVLQAYSNFGSDMKTSYTAGAKYGAAKGLEVGVDYQFAPDGSTGPINLQVKQAWWPGDAQTGYCLGLAGITGDWGEHHVFPYGVVSHKFNTLDRGHIGFAPQQDAQQFFVGYDHQFESALLRADYVRNDDADSNMYSLGALVPTKWGAVEGWVSRVDAASDNTVFTLKLDYAIDFTKSE
jgi:hypothetical protein